MDPNPLYYQTPDENQPLYRAALLSAGAVGFLIVVALGVNFVIHRGPSLSPAVRRQMASQETSPDDPVGDVKSKLMQDAMSTLGGSAASIRNLTSTGDENYSAPAPSVPSYGGGGNKQLSAPVIMNPNGTPVNSSPSMPPTHVSEVREYGSVSPDNLGRLLQGR